MLNDDFIAQKWFNSIFSELINYNLVQSPYEDWFLPETATLKKRPGLFTDQWVWGTYNWQAHWTLMWKIIVWWVMFCRDNLCNVYRFEKVLWEYVMTLVYDNTLWPLTLFSTSSYLTTVKQKALKVPYLSWKVKSWTADKVLSTNDDWSWNTILFVNEDLTFSSASVWQYIYFTDSASTKAKYQIRQITQYLTAKSVVLSSMFYSDPSDWAVNEPWETYATIGDVVVFNNLRTSAWLVLCLAVSDNEATYRNLWWNDIEIFEWRLWQISWYWTSVWWSIGSWEYEILDPTTVLWWSTTLMWQKMDSFVLVKNYLLVNQENSISVVWQIWQDALLTPIYTMNNISWWDSAFWYDSIFYEWGLYFYWKNKIFKWWDVVATSTNIIELQSKNQWIIINKFLKWIWLLDYVRCYELGDWSIIIQYTDLSTKTTILKYDPTYEWWLPWEYNLVIKDKFEPFYEDFIVCVWDKVCLMAWTDDLWWDISTKCVVTGSKQIRNSIFSLKKFKITLWYYSNVVWFKATIEIWRDVFRSIIKKDANWVSYLTRQNIWAWWWTLWSVPLWLMNLWWVNSVDSYIARQWLIGIPIWKKCTYYKLTLENIDNYDLNISGITWLVETGNPYITPLNNVF